MAERRERMARETAACASDPNCAIVTAQRILPRILEPFLFARPPIVFRPTIEFPGRLRPQTGWRPGPGWEWRGKPGEPEGSEYGNYFNPKTGEWLRYDMDHPGDKGIRPHWDYRDPWGNIWRWFGKGDAQLKYGPGSAA